MGYLHAGHLSLLRIAEFRRLGTAVALNSVGMMGENVVLGWLTLELTNSPFLVGVACLVLWWRRSGGAGRTATRVGS